MVFIGGGLGSICRYSIAKWLDNYNGAFPMATFLANVVSCIILGLFIGYHLKSGLTANYKLLIITGFCGGFSTFSTFSFETLDLMQNGDYTNAFLNIALSLFVCLLCIFIGVKITS